MYAIICITLLRTYIRTYMHLDGVAHASACIHDEGHGSRNTQHGECALAVSEETCMY
jgi:hypothetical protein